MADLQVGATHLPPAVPPRTLDVDLPTGGEPPVSRPPESVRPAYSRARRNPVAKILAWLALGGAEGSRPAGRRPSATSAAVSARPGGYPLTGR